MRTLPKTKINKIRLLHSRGYSPECIAILTLTHITAVRGALRRVANQNTQGKTK